MYVICISIYNDLLLDEGVLELELLLEDGEVAGGRTQVTGDTAQRVLQHIIMMLVSQYKVIISTNDTNNKRT